jgi:hypothetical protein
LVFDSGEDLIKLVSNKSKSVMTAAVAGGRLISLAKWNGNASA